jgi:hypothetical protein
LNGGFSEHCVAVDHDDIVDGPLSADLNIQGHNALNVLRARFLRILWFNTMDQPRGRYICRRPRRPVSSSLVPGRCRGLLWR